MRPGCCNETVSGWAEIVLPFAHPAAFEEVAFHAVQQPFAGGAFELLVPRYRVPPTFVFGLLDKSEVGIVLDPADASFHQPSILCGPMARRFGDGRRAV